MITVECDACGKSRQISDLEAATSLSSTFEIKTVRITFAGPPPFGVKEIVRQICTDCGSLVAQRADPRNWPREKKE